MTNAEYLPMKLIVTASIILYFEFIKISGIDDDLEWKHIFRNGMIVYFLMCVAQDLWYIKDHWK